MNPAEKKYLALRASVLKKVSPSRAEAIAEKRFAATTAERISEKLGDETQIHFVGSTARDTGLRGDRDVDLFVSFPRQRSREYIVKKTIGATKRALRANWVMHYAEHPYLQAKVGKYKVEVIPCFRIAPHEELKSAVDRSPLHMDYLQKRLTDEQKEDVRVLKKFLKNAGLYGAELRVKGFSGLLCEYLVLNYRSFWSLVENARNWRLPAVIDLEGHYAEGELDKKFTEPLVFIDAIDRKRNVAAVVSESNVNKFIALCRAFCENPSREFFFRKPARYSKAALRKAFSKRSSRALLLVLKKPAIVEDILFPQLEKTANALRKHFELRDFRVFGSIFFEDARHCFILLEFQSFSRAPTVRVLGPPLTNARACAEFLASRKNPLRGPFVEGGRLVVEEARADNDALALLKKMKADPVGFGVPSHFQKPLRAARVLVDGKVFGVSREALQELGNYFLKKEFWL